MGGYQLMISADIFRGRYRESLARPQAIQANKPLLYRFALPTANHVFLPGHRIMVQIQSIVPAVRSQSADLCAEYFLGQAGKIIARRHKRIYHDKGQESFVELPVVSMQ
jgi:hypothetical protein